MTQEEQSYATRRAATRAPVGKPVQLHFEETQEILDGICDNISIGGMFVELEPARPPGTLVRFEMPVDGGSICGLGEVVWMRSDSLGKGRAAGMGIKFRHLEQRDRQLIFKLVSEHIKERLARRQALTAPFALPEPELRRAVEPPREIAETPEPEPSAKVDDPLDKTLHRGANETRSAKTFDPPIGETDSADKTLVRPSQPGLFDPPPAEEPEPVDTTIQHSVTPDSSVEVDDPLEKTINRPSGEVAYHSDLFAPSDDEPADKTIQHPSWAGGPPEEVDLDDLDRTLSRSTQVDAVHPVSKRRWPILPILALLLLLLSAGGYLLRGLWLGTGDGPAAMSSEPAGAEDDPGMSLPAAENDPKSSRPPVESEIEETPSQSPETAPPFPPVAPPKNPEPDDPPSRTDRASAPPVATTSGEPSKPAQFFSRLVDIDWSVRDGGVKLVITADGQIPSSRYKHFRLGGESGPREVIQFLGVKKSLGDKVITVESPQVRQIRTGYHRKRNGNEQHVVLDLKAARYRVREISNRGTRLEISVH